VFQAIHPRASGVICICLGLQVCEYAPQLSDSSSDTLCNEMPHNPKREPSRRHKQRIDVI
jgi:hypothetical protein